MYCMHIRAFTRARCLMNQIINITGVYLNINRAICPFTTAFVSANKILLCNSWLMNSRERVTYAYRQHTDLPLNVSPNDVWLWTHSISYSLQFKEKISVRSLVFFLFRSLWSCMSSCNTCIALDSAGAVFHYFIHLSASHKAQDVDFSARFWCGTVKINKAGAA